MQPETKKNWTDALRSGAYQQAEGVLYRPNKGYCCLGVLCAVSKAEFEANEKGDAYVPYLDGKSLRKLNGDEYLNREALEMFGLTMDQQEKLAFMNDGIDGTPKHSFEQIAEYIDANF